MGLRLALTLVSSIELAGPSGTTNEQDHIDRHAEARKLAVGGRGCRGFLEVDTAHRKRDMSGVTPLVVMDPDREEVVGEIAEIPPAESDFPAAGAKG